MKYLQELKITLDKTEEAFPIYPIKKPINAVNLFLNLFEDINIFESVYVIYMNQRGLPIGWRKIAQGGISSTIVDLRLIFSPALICLASSFVICHNHPGGSLEPSEADINLTEKLKQAGEILSIKLLDHIILTDTDYYSFSDNGKI